MDFRNHLLVSGCHGTGKSTFISDLCNNPDNHCEPSERPPIPKEDRAHERNILRMLRYYLQEYSAEDRARQTNKIQVWDRCALDGLAYAKGFLKKRMIAQEEHDHVVAIYRALFWKYHEARIIFLDPSIDFVLRNISKRQTQTGRIKWNETDDTYTRCVHEGFRRVYLNGEHVDVRPKILHIPSEDREERVRLAEQWMHTHHQD